MESESLLWYTEKCRNQTYYNRATFAQWLRVYLLFLPNGVGGGSSGRKRLSLYGICYEFTLPPHNRDWPLALGI